LKLNKAILTQEQINNIVEDVKKKEIEEQYQKDLYLLAQVIYSEVGSDWISDEVQLMCANVVMNRVESQYFSHTIYDVVHAPSQYQFIQDKVIVVPNKRALDNAKKILDGLRVLPKNVVYQSEYKNLGDGNYKKVKTKYSTIYFNYKKEIK
jgi:spore germination cell wall hydrolase CwlJ-like protein